MIYGFITYKEALAKVVRDLNLGDAQFPELDFIEWLCEAIRTVGANNQLIESTIKLQVINFVANLPIHGINKIISIHKTKEFATKKLMSTFNQSTEVNFYKQKIAKIKEDLLVETDPQKLLNLENDLEVTTNHLNNLIDFYLIDEKRPNPYTQQELLEPSHYNDDNGVPILQDSYQIRNNQIILNFQYGNITLKFLHLPIDEDGILLVPDNIEFQNLILWKIIYQLYLSNSDLLKNQDLKNYQLVSNNYQSALKAAHSSTFNFDTQLLNQIANQYTSMFTVANPLRDNLLSFGERKNPSNI